MREIFKYGSVGRAPRERCLYPEANRNHLAGLALRALHTWNAGGP
jgi:hypothetical protein